jgi:hypothetical protein
MIGIVPELVSPENVRRSNRHLRKKISPSVEMTPGTVIDDTKMINIVDRGMQRIAGNKLLLLTN